MADDDDKKDKGFSPPTIALQLGNHGAQAQQREDARWDRPTDRSDVDHEIYKKALNSPFGGNPTYYAYLKTQESERQQAGQTLAAQENAFRSMDLGETNKDGSLSRYDQNPHLKQDPKNIDISDVELTRISQASQFGSQWDPASKAEHEAARQRIADAIDGSVNGTKDGHVTLQEIATVVNRLKEQGVTVNVDQKRLMETLNSGLPMNVQPTGRTGP